MPSSAPLILGFDTSGPWCGVALLRGDAVVAAQHEEMRKGQAERLFPMIEEVLAASGAELAALDAIGVGTGPGNFTGIRIAVSAARGLALSLGIPAVGVSLLEAMACGAPQGAPVLSALSAPRDHVYIEGFGTAQDIPRTFLPLDEISKSFAEDGLAVVGTAAAEVAAHLGATESPAAQDPAEAIARIAAQRWQGEVPPPAPLYFRPADAAPASDPPPRILDET
ncbi:tRNA (adenosine(37)-N6)-threonylcarbamoyltransferase complex dimerization subunit type 1 TsaB [Rhodobacteraceae bacterium 63075]|nr:tRNA (adenosine(37)-N6)-threonylcarbamoyltransferase complex dimerization subunit type 1 TsaB [Rhodobacteraceae bacterium 63075]